MKPVALISVLACLLSLVSCGSPPPQVAKSPEPSEVVVSNDGTPSEPDLVTLLGLTDDASTLADHPELAGKLLPVTDTITMDAFLGLPPGVRQVVTWSRDQESDPEPRQLTLREYLPSGFMTKWGTGVRQGNSVANDSTFEWVFNDNNVLTQLIETQTGRVVGTTEYRTLVQGDAVYFLPQTRIVNNTYYRETFEGDTVTIEAFSGTDREAGVRSVFHAGKLVSHWTFDELNGNSTTKEYEADRVTSIHVEGPKGPWSDRFVYAEEGGLPTEFVHREGSPQELRFALEYKFESGRPWTEVRRFLVSREGTRTLQYIETLETR